MPNNSAPASECRSSRQPSSKNLERDFTQDDRSYLKVVKRDGRIENFNKQKLLNGILKSFTNLGIPYEKQLQIADEVERTIYLMGKDKIDSQKIGEEILKKLKKVSQVAYVRFASVYHKFTDVKEFNKLISEIGA